jgi:hypothetical protein
MNAQRTIFGLFIALLFIVPAATAQVAYFGSCCEWGRTSTDSEWGSIGNCGPGLSCLPVIGASNTSSCQEQVIEEGCQWINDVCTGTCQSGACVDIDGQCTCPQDDGCGLKPYKVFVDTQVAGAEGYCDGYCANGGTCVLNEPTGVVGSAEPCYCKPPVNVPEFATGLVALAVMLLSPAFAYLAVRKRH